MAFPSPSWRASQWLGTRSGLCVVLICICALNSLTKFNGRTLLLRSDEGNQETNQLSISSWSIATREVHNSRQDQARFALYRMEQEGVLTTNFSRRETVLRRGFPRQWKPCALENRFHQNRRDNAPLRVVVTGGSPSSRPGSNCSADGRYSGLMQERFRIEEDRFWGDVVVSNNNTKNLPKLQFQVVNMAQGGTSSVMGALLMDQFFDTDNTDIIVWEFLINDDSLAGKTQEQVRKLDFWLTRVHAFFAQAGKRPPPIIINYLWGYNQGWKLMTNRSHTIDHNPLEYTADLIDTYRDLGWDIAVMNVGAAVDEATVMDNPFLMFDDGSHPSCAGAGLIGDMLAHIVYSNLAAADDKAQCDNTLPQTDIDSMVPSHAQVQPDVSKIEELVGGLWGDLFRADAVVGSLTAWEPQLGNSSKLNYNPQATQGWSQQITGKAESDRDDRKISYVFPRCDNEKGHHGLNLTLNEPNLKWIGISNVNPLEIYINGVYIPLRLSGKWKWCLCGKYFRQWIELPQHLPKADKYTIQMCPRQDQSLAHLRALVGVSLPDVAVGTNKNEGAATIATV